MTPSTSFSFPSPRLCSATADGARLREDAKVAAAAMADSLAESQAQHKQVPAERLVALRRDVLALRERASRAEAERDRVRAERDEVSEAHRSCGLNAIELAALRREVADRHELQQQAADQHHELHALRAELARAKARVASVDSALASRQNEAVDLQERLTAVTIERDEAGMLARDLQARLTAEARALGETRDELRMVSAKRKEEVEALHEAVDVSAERSEGLAGELRAARMRLAAVQEERDTLRVEKVGQWEGRGGAGRGCAVPRDDLVAVSC